MSEDYKVIKNNFFYQFVNPIQEKKRLGLTEKKAKHDYMMQICLETIIENFDERKNKEIDLSEIINKKYPNNRKMMVEILKNAGIKELIINHIPSYIKTKPEYKDITKNDFLQIFPLDISDIEYKECTDLNKELADGIIAIKRPEIQHVADPSYIALMENIIKDYGTKPYLNGQIAAQSMDLIGSCTGVTAIWSVCGTGYWGTDNDVAYGDLLALAFNARTMAQIRRGLKDFGVDASGTPDGFDAVSAIIMLHARGNVYLFAGFDFVKGRTLIETELPIAIRNPYIGKIIWVDTSHDALKFVRDCARSATSTRVKQGENKFNIKPLAFNKEINKQKAFYLKEQVVFERQFSHEITVNSINQAITNFELHSKTSRDIQLEKRKFNKGKLDEPITRKIMDMQKESQVIAREYKLQKYCEDLCQPIKQKETDIIEFVQGKFKQKEGNVKISITFDLRFPEESPQSLMQKPVEEERNAENTIDSQFPEESPQSLMQKPLQKVKRALSMSVTQSIRPLKKVKRASSVPAKKSNIQK